MSMLFWKFIFILDAQPSALSLQVTVDRQVQQGNDGDIRKFQSLLVHSLLYQSSLLH